MKTKRLEWNWGGQRKRLGPDVSTFLFAAEEGGLKFGNRVRKRSTVPKSVRETIQWLKKHIEIRMFGA